MSTFIERFDVPELPVGSTVARVAIKDLIDVAGHLTTAGCPAVAERATPAAIDAPLLAGTRAAEARGEVQIVGKVNLHELAFGSTGVNPWYGTPVNPLGVDLVPGGSSSGSAVAVGSFEADVAFGTDTGGSVRIPSACCGTVGLKTTYGRIDTTGVWPLAATLDSVGPMARDIAGLVLGMQLLEPGFAIDVVPTVRIGRVRVHDVDPIVDAAVDSALRQAGFEVTDIEDPGWAGQWDPGFRILLAEAWRADGHLLDRRDLVSTEVASMLDLGRELPADELAAAYEQASAWRTRLLRLLEPFDLLALPAMPVLPTRLGEPADALASLMVAANLAGVPALAQPVPSGEARPASLQLVGPHDSEALLLAAGQVVQDAIG